jgi:prolyl oligopeptidase
VQEWLALDKLRPMAYADITYENGRVFYKKTLGGENVGKLYFREGWDGSEKLLFDPSTYKAGVATTINSFVPSWNGKYVILGLTSGGTEWSELRILNVKDGSLLPDSIYPSWGAFGWMKNNQAFFYDAGKVTDLKSLELQLNRKTKVHKLGSEVVADSDIFSDESNPELGITAKEDPYAYVDESYPDYIVGAVSTVQNEMRLYYAPVSELKNGKIKWDVLCKTSDNLVRGMTF